MYKGQKKRETLRQEYDDIEDYLSSLDLNIKIYKNNESMIPRMSQMSQKTNQFNLTTKRYTENDIKNFVSDISFDVFAISVSDKYGDSGVTGLCITEYDNNKKRAIIDTLLMSCRIIGRNIEFAFIDSIISSLLEKNINVINSAYIRTQKNHQVNEFYDNCSFSLVESTDKQKLYELEIKRYKPRSLAYIEVTHG